MEMLIVFKKNILLVLCMEINKHDTVAGGSVHTNTFAGKGYSLRTVPGMLVDPPKDGG